MNRSGDGGGGVSLFVVCPSAKTAVKQMLRIIIIFFMAVV
jgi:hypothetical protein